MLTLLELGTSVGSVEIVNYAKNRGVYTIVADNLPSEKSAAKRVANEHVLISTADTKKLIELAKERNITAAFAGVSEFNLESARIINEAIGVPFYYNPKQWNQYMNKGSFRKLCEKFGIRTPRTYYVGKVTDYKSVQERVLHYPVIVKPVDNGANIGITICYKDSTLNDAVEFALAGSKSKEIIIEEFITGPEISSTYVVQDGKCRLVCFGKKFAYKNEKGLQALANAYIYPAPSIDEYVSKASPIIERMILETGLNNCTVFFQGIESKECFYLFEAGLRMEGTATYRITEAMNGTNFMKFMVDNALGINTEYKIENEDPYLHGKKCIIYSIIGNEGIISAIEGTERIEDNDSIISFEQRHYKGSKIENDGTLRQIMFRFTIQNDDIKEVIKTINWINETIKVYDENGKDMIIRSFDPKILL